MFGWLWQQHIALVCSRRYHNKSGFNVKWCLVSREVFLVQCLQIGISQITFVTWFQYMDYTSTQGTTTDWLGLIYVILHTCSHLSIPFIDMCLPIQICSNQEKHGTQQVVIQQYFLWRLHFCLNHSGVNLNIDSPQIESKKKNTGTGAPASREGLSYITQYIKM